MARRNITSLQSALSKTPTPGPVVLGRYLEALRVARGESRRSAAQRLGMSYSMLGRVECGRWRPDHRRARELLRGNGVSDDCQSEILTRFVNAGDVLDDAAPGSVERLAVVERAARRLRVFGGYCVPPIVQTPAYAQAMAHTPRPPRPAVALLPLSRQLVDGDGRVLTLLLDETVLMRPVGGPAVLDAQLAYLQVLMEDRRVDVRVLPLTETFQPSGPNLAELVLDPGTRLFVDERLTIFYSTGPQHGWYAQSCLDRIQAAALSAEATYERLGLARKEAAR